MPEKEPQINNTENIEGGKEEQVAIKSAEFKRPEKSALQKQIETLNKEQEQIREFLDILSGLTVDSEIKSEADSEVTKEMQNENSEQIKSKIIELRGIIEKEFIDLENQATIVEENYLPLTEESKVRSIEDVNKLADTIQNASNQLNKKQQVKQIFKSKKETVNSLIEIYLKKRLTEAGFNDDNELNKTIDEQTEQLNALSKGKINRWKNRKEIKDIRNRLEPLYDLNSATWNIHETMPSLSPSGDIREYHDQLMGYSFGKVVEYCKNKVEESNKESREITTETLKPKIVNKLDDEYINHYIRKDLEKIFNHYESQKEEDPNGYNEWAFDPKVIPKAIQLMKESFSDNGYLSKNRNQFGQYTKTRERIREEIEDLPFFIKEIVKQHIPAEDFEKCADDNYNLMVNVAHKLPEYYTRRNYEKMAEMLVNFTKKDGVPFEVTKYWMATNNIFENIGNGKLFKEIKDTIYEDIDIKRWLIFEDSPEIKKLFQQGEVEILHKVLKEDTLKRLISTKEHTKQSNRYGEEILNFQEADVAPYIIMNCFREPGYSGEYPFIRWDSRSRSTELYKYISGLSKEELAKLKQTNITGLNEFLEIIDKHPDSFLQNTITIKNQDGKEEIRNNPIYLDVEKNLSKMCLHYIKSGDNNEREFVLSLYERLYKAPIDQEMSQELTKLLKSKNNIQSVLAAVKAHANQGDLEAGNLLISSWQEIDNETKESVRSMGSSLLGNIAEREVKPEEIKSLTEVFEITSEKFINTHQFIRQLKKIDPGINFYGIEIEDMNKYIKLAEHREELIPLINQLKDYGYDFNINHDEALSAILKDKEYILTKLDELKQNFPDFQYHLYESDLVIENEGQEDEERRTIYVINPYELFTRTTQPGDLLKHLDEIIEKKNEYSERLSKQLSRGFIKALRRTDPMLRENPESITKIPDESYKNFHLALEKLTKKFAEHQGANTLEEEFFSSKDLQRFIARQPERIDEVLSIPERVPELLKLMRIGGPLQSNKEQTIKNIFLNGDALRRAREIESIFTKVVPYWKQLFLYTEARLGDNLANATSNYPITEIADVPISNIIKKHIESKRKDNTRLTRLESMVKNQELIDKLASGEEKSIPFTELSGIYKKIVLRDYLKRTIETSRSQEKKIEAGLINRQFVHGDLILSDGDYIHGGDFDVIDPMLLNGNLPNECLGENANPDAYPFHVDFTRLEEEYISNQENDIEKILTNSLSRSYGSTGSLSTDGQIFYIYKKNFRNWEQDKEYDGSSTHHALTLGGFPSTEIRGIVLRKHEATLEKIKQSILENGFYIPVYDIQGKLLFTSEEYDQIFQNENLKVRTEVWNYSLKTGEQMGSNLGAQFTVPTGKGPTKYYVKFINPEESAHMWCEQLADDIYTELDIPVPNTKIVRVEGTYGHASEMIGDLKEGKNVQEKLKDGFVADALLSNWDIPYAPGRNTGGANGELYRIDNGGALLFRAKGQRKTKELFGAIVHELKKGTNKKRLGLGMRQEYHGLTENNIKKQTEHLKTKLTDEKIDQLVDGVRMNVQDRDYLKDILRKRRDYIVKEILGE